MKLLKSIVLLVSLQLSVCSKGATKGKNGRIRSKKKPSSSKKHYKRPSTQIDKSYLKNGHSNSFNQRSSYYLDLGPKILSTSPSPKPSESEVTSRISAYLSNYYSITTSSKAPSSSVDIMTTNPTSEMTPTSTSPKPSVSKDAYTQNAYLSKNDSSNTPSTSPFSNFSIMTIKLTPECKDNKFYQNPLGGHCGCSLFEATDCQKWDIFLTDIEIVELFDNCPVACGVCSHPIQTPSVSPSISSPSTSCKNNNLYVSPVNNKFGCEIYDGSDCFIWSVFLTNKQMQDIFLECPEACGVDCISNSNPQDTNEGIMSNVDESFTPSPTLDHAFSSNPSRMTIHEQTSMPTESPSVSPTISYTSGSSADPTSEPSQTPSSEPSALPSDVPSTYPTSGPSAIPTLDPSLKPSTGPSALPSVSPSYTPSVGPTSEPSQTPLSEPSAFPSVSLRYFSPSSFTLITKTSRPSSISRTDYSSKIPSRPIVTTTWIPSFVPISYPSYVPSKEASSLSSFNSSSIPSDLNCEDDATYFSPVNPKFGCELYCGTNCTMWGSLLNATEFEEIFTHCPKTCDERCWISTINTFSSNTLVKSNGPTTQSSMAPSSGSSIVPTRARSITPSRNLSSLPSSRLFQPSVANDSVTVMPSEDSPCTLSDVTRSTLIFNILQNVSDINLLSDSSSPQGKAIDWLINKDGAFLCPNATKLIQRYTLAVIYYSTKGDNWNKCSASPFANDNCGQEAPFINKMRFLSDDNECLWAGVRCSDTNCVTQIEFEANNLDGTIPKEISSLEDLEFLGLERGNLIGEIPSSLPSLTKLFFIDLDYNNLTGTLPSGIFSLTNLKQLDINNNHFTGGINGIQFLKKMEFLQLHHNLFTGFIPQGIVDLKNLQVFTIYGNNLINDNPLLFCENRDYNGGNLTTFINNCSSSCQCCSSTY